jgi:peptidoglycan/xylan/chitin deacetylase (PgdA/CDA1 family)
MKRHKVRGPYGKQGLVVRALYLLFALVSWILSGFGRGFARRTIVLCYHGVSDKHASRFKKQVLLINKLMAAGWNRKKCPSVEITFDDAFANLLVNALPLLERYQIPTTIFAVSGNLGEKPHWNMPTGHPDIDECTMTVEHLMALRNKPMVHVGSHTATHPDLSAIPLAQAQAELENAKQTLETLLECPINDLAVPHGAYNDAVLAMAIEVGYTRIYTLDPKLNGIVHDGAVIGRFLMSPDAWDIELMLTCAGAYAWLAPWRRLISRVMGLEKELRK